MMIISTLWVEWGTLMLSLRPCPRGRKAQAQQLTIATRMMGSFPHIKINLLVGIGGGLPNGENDIRLGDMVVSVPHGEYGGVVQYDMGKSMKNGFRRTGYLNAPDEKLLAVLIRMPDRLEGHPSEVYPGEEFDQLYHDHNSEVTCGKCDEQGRVKRAPGGRNRGPHVFYGTIASGNAVIKDAAMRDVLIKNHGVLCVEMEAAGLMNSSFRCLVIRGISDYADSHKNDKWQDYAAATAARYAKEFLNAVPPSVVRDPISTEGMY
jgi:nucleoside phosphorylase